MVALVMPPLMIAVVLSEKQPGVYFDLLFLWEREEPPCFGEGRLDVCGIDALNRLSF